MAPYFFCDLIRQFKSCAGIKTMQLLQDVAGYRNHVFPLKFYQACGAVKPGKVELNSTFPAPRTSCSGHPRCQNRMFPLKVELPPVCPSATAGSAYDVFTVIWKPGFSQVFLLVKPCENSVNNCFNIHSILSNNNIETVCHSLKHVETKSKGCRKCLNGFGLFFNILSITSNRCTC